MRRIESAVEVFGTRRPSNVVSIGAVFALTAFIAIIALLSGKYYVSPSQLWLVLSNKLIGTAATQADAAIETVVWNVRLPRVLGGLLIGAGLSTAGTVYQDLFRNPRFRRTSTVFQPEPASISAIRSGFCNC